MATGWDESSTNGYPSGLAASWYNSLLDLIGRGTMTTYYYNGGQTSTSTSNLRQMIQYLSRSLSNIGYFSERVLNQALPNISSAISSGFDVLHSDSDRIVSRLDLFNFTDNGSLVVSSDDWFKSNLPTFYTTWSERSDFDIPSLSQLPSASSFAMYQSFLSLDDFSSNNHIISSVDVSSQGLVGLLNILNSNIVAADALIATPVMTYFADHKDGSDPVNIVSLFDWFNTLGQWQFDSVFQLQQVLADDNDLQLKQDTNSLVFEASDNFFTGSSGSKVSVSNISDAAALSSGFSDLTDTGGSVSSFFVQTGSDSHVWDWFTSETQSDLDQVNSGVRLMSKKSSSNDIVTHYAADNYAQLQSLLGGD